MDTVETIRLVNLAIRLVTLGLCIVSWSRRPRSRLWIIPPLSWAVHEALYYSALLTGLALSPTLQNIWSCALGLHEGFLMIGAVWLVIWPAKGWHR